MRRLVTQAGPFDVRIGKKWKAVTGPYSGFHKYHFAFLVVDECSIPLELLISPWTAEFKEAKLSP